MMGDDYKALGYVPVIHWITHEEVCVQQEVFAVRECRPSHPDPTADAAIGRVVRDERREKRKQRGNRKPFRQPKVGVWRWDDERQKDERRKQDGR